MTATKAYSNKDMNGLKVINLGAPANGSNDAARKVDVETAYTAAISRANHTGTQLASENSPRANSRLGSVSAPVGARSAASSSFGPKAPPSL